MKNFLSILFVFLGFCMMQAQSTDKGIKYPKSEKLVSYKDALNFEKIQEKGKAVVQGEAIDISLLNIDYERSKGSYFKLLKQNELNNTLWLKGAVDHGKTTDWENRLNEWLDGALRYLSFDPQKHSFKILDSWTDELKHVHSRVQELYDSIPVYGKECIIHGVNRRPLSMNGQLLDMDTKKINSNLEYGEEEAKESVLAVLENYRNDALDIQELDLDMSWKQWSSELVYYSIDDKNYELAYHIIVHPNPAERIVYFVSAVDGRIMDHFSTICKFHSLNPEDGHVHNKRHRNCTETKVTVEHNAGSAALLDGPATANATDLRGLTRLINTYEFSTEFFLIDASREMFNSSQSVLPNDPKGVIWTIDLNNTSPINENSLYTHIFSSDNNWSNSPEGVSAHYNAGLAYEYFKQNFGRESISGTGENILSFVNVTDEYENSMGNAFWNGIGIYYGNGDEAFESLGRALDVAGHEMSHGVIESTANLEYRNESGALNESFADIFGVMIDRDDWTIGEEVVKLNVFPSGALRSFTDPHNGAQTGNWQGGWQPKHYNERYQGQEDNGGVHINSGISNHAYYLFANEVGKDIAERIYYRALTTYMTRSTGFKELRYAVVQSAMDLSNNSVVQAARSAFDQVGILDESNTDFEEELGLNPGQDLLLVSDESLSKLYVFDLISSEAVFNPLSTTDVLSKPSVTDDGTRLVFVGTDNHVHLIDIDWNMDPPQAVENIISNSADWRNAVISKDGRFIALLENIADNSIIVFDLLTSASNIFTLTNPTYSSGVNTGEVQYADVMEFDAAGTHIMYDAFNSLTGNAGTIEFWDIGFVEVWNQEFDTWALGDIDKLFNSLPEGVNIGNPAFSKNSPHIIALDIFDEFEFEILGINLETQELNSIIPNSGLGYPSYSRDDGFMVYDLDLFGYTDLGILELNEDKISRIDNSDQILLTGGKWGIWFSNGERNLSSTDERVLEHIDLFLHPNPVADILNIKTGDKEFLNKKMRIQIHDMNGALIYNDINEQYLKESLSIELSDLVSGSYILSMFFEEGRVLRKFIKL